MARYIARVRSPRPPEEVFAYLADMRNFAEWDPGITDVVQVEGQGAGSSAAYDVTFKSIVGHSTLRYEVVDYEPPKRLLLRAEGSRLISNDEITVLPEADGCEVVYDAQLDFKGILALADPVLGVAFDRIGDRAVKGLVSHLDGERVRP